jgi:hypothetical protein
MTHILLDAQGQILCLFLIKSIIKHRNLFSAQGMEGSLHERSFPGQVVVPVSLSQLTAHDYTH